MEEVKTWDAALEDTTSVLVERELVVGELLLVVEEAPLLALLIKVEVVNEDGLTDEELDTDVIDSEVIPIVELEVVPLEVTGVLRVCVVLLDT